MDLERTREPFSQSEAGPLRNLGELVSRARVFPCERLCRKTGERLGARATYVSQRRMEARDEFQRITHRGVNCANTNGG